MWGGTPLSAMSNHGLGIAVSIAGGSPRHQQFINTGSTVLTNHHHQTSEPWFIRSMALHALANRGVNDTSLLMSVCSLHA